MQARKQMAKGDIQMDQRKNMGATAYPADIDINHVCELVVSRLKEEILGPLPSEQRLAGSNSAKDALPNSLYFSL